MTVPQWLILAGAVGMCIDTVGWVLIFMDVLPEYPYFPIAVGCFVVYGAGRVLRKRELRRTRQEEFFDTGDEGDDGERGPAGGDGGSQA